MTEKKSTELEKKVVFKTKHFDVIEKGSIIGIEPIELCVIVMPFERDANGLPKTIGVLKEYNPLREGNYSVTLVTGRTNDEDPDLLATAMRELKEESGYDVIEHERWCYLGMLTTSKMVEQELPCFAVDVTGLEASKKEGDGTTDEDNSSFLLLPTKEALDSNDCFIPALFMKVFKYIFKSDISADGEAGDAKDINKLKQRLDMRYLSMDGVNGSLVKNVDGVNCIEYTVTEITDSISKMIPAECDGVKILVTVANDDQSEKVPD